MTPEPTPPPRPVADWVVAKHKPVAAGLLVLAVLFVAVAGICFWRTNSGSGKPGGGPDDAAFIPPSPYRSVYLWGGITAIASAAVVGLAGATRLVRLPSTNADRERYSAASLILVVGAGVGVLLLVFGLALFRIWFDSLVKWVDVRDASEAWKPLTAILVLLAGAGLMFAAAQPARADERNYGWIRRSVYGINFGLTVLLMVFGLVTLNVLVALKAPGKLDTTENRVYSLTRPTETYLADLAQTVQVTVTFTPDGSPDPLEKRLANDLRRLLEACQEVNPQRFKVTTLHPVLNQSDMEKLLKRHGQPGAVIETAGRTEFVKASDLSDREGFRGEAELVKRLLFLTEDRDRTVYFAQGRGEPDVVPSPERKTSGRSARSIAETLSKSNSEVQALRFDPVNPVVPADAAVVAVIDPREPFTPEEINALRTYLNKPRANGKKGKLIVAAGPVPKRDKTGVLDTGLDALLAEFGVTADNRYLLGVPSGQFNYTEFVVFPEATAARAEHPVALELAEGALFTNCRVLNGAEGGPFTVTPIGFSVPERRGCWFETEPPTNPKELFAGIANSPQIRQQKKYTNNGQWPLVVTVAEPVKPEKAADTPKDVSRLVVFGSGEAFVDSAGSGGGNATLFASAVDWLRDRPPVASVASKPYGVYKPLRGADSATLVWLPIGITLLGIVALGLGVWSFRRNK